MSSRELKPNLQKCSIFVISVNDVSKEVLCEQMSTEENSLPVSYLGVPLIYIRLIKNASRSV